MNRADAIMLLAVEMDESSYVSIIPHRNEYRTVLRIRRHDPENLKLLHQTLGGTLSESKNGYWYWAVDGRRCMRILHEVYPEIDRKKEHIEILFALEASKKKTKRRKGGLTQEVRDYRQGLIDKIRGLNGAYKGQTAGEGVTVALHQNHR